jgi:hypothetical protein
MCDARLWRRQEDGAVKVSSAWERAARRLALDCPSILGRLPKAGVTLAADKLPPGGSRMPAITVLD